MEGSVSWTTEGQASGYGKVTTCKQVGNRLNIVFTCDDVGEGQLTLTITTVEQFASARFIYAGARERTYARVVGPRTYKSSKNGHCIAIVECMPAEKE